MNNFNQLTNLTELVNSMDVHYLATLFIIFSICGILCLLAFQRQKKQDQLFNAMIQKQELAVTHLHNVCAAVQHTNQLLTTWLVPEEAESDAGEDHAHSDAVSIQPSPKLYVGNVDYSVTEDELVSIFGKYGEIALVSLPVDRYTRKTRGFGFVTFSSQEYAQQALELHGAELKGRAIQVNFAKER